MVVNCDYKGNSNGIFVLDKVEADIEGITTLFRDTLKYKTDSLPNPKKSELTVWLKEKANEIPSNKKIVVFSFLGHGHFENNCEYILTYDGDKLHVLDEIVLPIVSRDELKNIPKLFLISMCHRSLTLEASKKSSQCSTHFQKSQENPPLQLSSEEKCIGPAKGKAGSKWWVEGNYRIDFSLIPCHIPNCDGNGSTWMRTLAESITKENDSFVDVAADVARRVSSKQTKPQQLDRLDVGALYLK